MKLTKEQQNCKYCNNFYGIKEENYDLKLTIDCYNCLINADDINAITIDINYCPMCGKKLSDIKWEEDEE